MTYTVKTVVDPTVPVVCDDCDRPLTDPVSRAAGRGPVCAAKYHRPRGRREASPDQLTIPKADMPDSEARNTTEAGAEHDGRR
ncbi:DUF6011 domain-containing protein [Streptomyces sp. IB2014 016-6]|uniref:DUF6011 domain-containing protein n=1 Tax=Streptomyces sp. IB2014 016-6 TaxID=2517818 RepID=UPI001650B18F|nr:DUF6011 domain-containing protein [Streptomyces sp. IB2014 016-6]